MKIKKGFGLEKINGQYLPGDFVVLGHGGAGWGDSHRGKIVQIRDIGNHLLGTLFSPSYDFYVYPNRAFDHTQQLCRSGPRGGGGSTHILRHATDAEIRKLMSS